MRRRRRGRRRRRRRRGRKRRRRRRGRRRRRKRRGGREEEVIVVVVVVVVVVVYQTARRYVPRRWPQAQPVVALQPRGSVVGAVVVRDFVCFWYFGVPEAIHVVFRHVTVPRPRVRALLWV